MQQRLVVHLRSLACVALSALGACYMAVEDATADVAESFEELNRPNDALLWPSGSATVCWSNDTNTNRLEASLKTDTRTWIAESISATAKFSFSDWSTCSGSNNNKLVLSFDPTDAFGSVTNPQTNPLRQGWMGLNDSTRISFGLNFATPSGAARPDAQITAVHEFMHAIGFGHEFNRPENEGPKDCSWQEPQPGETYGTTYDHDSITNGGYCHWNTKLSEQDGIGLRAAYGTFANTELSANNNLDGRLEVVYTYTGNVVYHRWQNSPNSGPWIGPHLLGAPDNAAKQVVLGKSPGRGLEAIYLGTDDVVYHNAQSGSGWSGQSPLGTSSNKGKRIVVADNQIGLLVVYIGTDNKLYTNRQSITGQWLGEQNIGGTLSAKELAIGRNADGRLEVFYTDASDVLWHIWQSTAVSSTWHGPLLLGTSTNKAKQLRVASHQDGRMEVVYIGMNNVLHHTWQTVVNGGWSGEALLATSQTTGKQLVIQKDAQNRLELVFTDMNDVLRRFRQNAPNTGWSNSSLLASAGDKAKKLTIGANQNGNLELIFVGTNNLLYHAWQTSPGSWSAVAELD